MFMKCKRIELGDLFPFYLNGDLCPDQERMIEDHLPHCPECQQELLFWIALSQQGVSSWEQEGRQAKAIAKAKVKQPTKNVLVSHN